MALTLEGGVQLLSATSARVRPSSTFLFKVKALPSSRVPLSAHSPTPLPLTVPLASLRRVAVPSSALSRSLFRGLPFPEASPLLASVKRTPSRADGGVRAAASSSSASSPDGRKESRWDPLLANSDVGCPVPPEQQPVNEYSDLAEAFFFNWATMGPFNLSMRLGSIGLFFTILVGFPISAATFDPEKQALQCVISALGGGLFPVIVLCSRLYLGWQYVGARLASATVEYEETGWYDGQTWVKTPELLARDRLLSSYRVRPVLKKLRNILVGLGGSLALVVATVALLPPAYAPKPELPRAYPLEEIDTGYFTVNVIRAQEKGGPAYDPSAVEEFEGTEEEEEEDDGFPSGSVAMYRMMHGGAPPVAGEEAAAAQVAYLAQGYGFQFLSAEGEEEDFDPALFSRQDAAEVAQDLRGRVSVAIVGQRQEVEGYSEDTMRGVEGAEGEDLSLLGAGVSGASRDVRISDRLAIGPDGELQVVKSLKPAED